MKTLRYRIGNEVKPGILDQEGNIRDVSSLVKDWDNKNLTISKLNEVKKINPTSLPLVENSDGYAPCVCKESIGKFICIGLNYSDHAEETGQKVPPEPMPNVETSAEYLTMRRRRTISLRRWRGRVRRREECREVNLNSERLRIVLRQRGGGSGLRAPARQWRRS